MLLGSFAAVALMLAAIGLYGLVSYSVSQRTHEIGLRMALGAGRRHILWLVIGRASRLATMGLLLGLLGSFALTRLITSLLFGVSARDPATFAGIASLLAVVAILASLVPALRATWVDPTVALRQE